MSDNPEMVQVRRQLLQQYMRVTNELMRRVSVMLHGGVDASGGGRARARAERQRRQSKPKGGETRPKIIAALNKHHGYADGGCLNDIPIGVSELARLADVGKASASRFMRQVFGGHKIYQHACADRTMLLGMLKLLNGDLSVGSLFGRTPPGESDRDGE